MISDEASQFESTGTSTGFLQEQYVVLETEKYGQFGVTAAEWADIPLQDPRPDLLPLVMLADGEL